MQQLADFKFTECAGCGYCCKQTPCLTAIKLHGLHIDECPELVFRKGRYWCNLVVKDFTRWHERLFINVGCPSSLNTWRNDVKYRK